MSVLLLWIVLAIAVASIGSIGLVIGLALWVGSATVVEQAGRVWRSSVRKILPLPPLRYLAVALHGLGGLAIGNRSNGWWAICIGLAWLIGGFDLLVIEFVLRLLDRRKQLGQRGLFSGFWGVAASCLIALALGYWMGAVVQR